MKKRYVSLGVGVVLLGLLFCITHERSDQLSHQNPVEESSLLSDYQGFSPLDSESKNVPVMTTRPSGGKETISLISSGEETDFKWTSRTPAAKRVRLITPDSKWLNAKPRLKTGDTIELALFDDAVFSAKISAVTPYPNGAVGITAHLLGGKKGVAYLSYCGGELRGSVEVRGADDYYVRYDSGTESHYAIQVDRKSSDVQSCGTVRIPPVAEAQARVWADDSVPQPQDQELPVAESAPPENLPEGTAVVDLMIVYTPAARVAEGGTNGMNNNITLSMQKANEAHSNSLTKVYINLVHSAEISYVESGDPGLDLDRLTFTGGANNAMDEVHAWRDTYDADLVSLCASDPGTGGLAWRLTDENGSPIYGFSLTRVQQTDWTYTSVHEWGHNMGCSHSKTQTHQPWTTNGLYTYSAGWQWDDTASSASDGYCSIMTYENFDGSGGDEYEEIPFFSNPDIDYVGDSTHAVGHAADGDNARCIRNTRYAVSEYRINPVTISEFPYSNSFELAFIDWDPYGNTAAWEREDGTDGNLINNAPNIATTNAADGEFYLMVPGSGNESQTAELEAVFDLSELSSANFEFSYCMYSVWGIEGTNTLQVSTNSGSGWIDLWSNSGESDNSWYQINISLSAYVGVTNVHLRFKADLGGTWYENYMCLDAFGVTGAVASTDNDADGIPNDWETQYYGGATNAVATNICANGLNTVLEAYIAGLNPTNSTSIFELSNLRNVLGWDAVSGRVYAVFWTSNLLSGFQCLETNVTGSFTDTVHEADQKGFYKIKVELAP